MLEVFKKINDRVKAAEAEDDKAASDRKHAIIISIMAASPKDGELKGASGSGPELRSNSVSQEADGKADEEETTDDDSTQGECPQCRYKCSLLKFATTAGKD